MGKAGAEICKADQGERCSQQAIISGRCDQRGAQKAGDEGPGKLEGMREEDHGVERMERSRTSRALAMLKSSASVHSHGKLLKGSGLELERKGPVSSIARE